VISASTISQVRDRADLVAVVSEHVPSLKLRGRSYTGLCPFHKEKSPSFHVNRERGLYHCFGCKESGGVFDFVMRMEGATFPEAIRSLAERFGVTVEEDKGGANTGQEEGKRRQREDLFAANAAAAEFYERMLREHEHAEYAIAELDKRGLRPGTNPEIDDALQAFRIGYAPSGWDGLAQFLKTQGISPATAESAGLLVARSSGTGHYDRFRHRLMFAVLDVQGRVLAFSGRTLPELPGEERREGAKYINTSETPVYTKGAHLFGLYQARHEIRTAGEAVVVEGNFDVVALHARGIKNVVAPLGTAFTADQAGLLRRFASSVTLLFDADAAGQKATLASREPLRVAKLAAKVATLPDGKDPDDFVRLKGVEALNDVLARARGMLEALIDSSLDVTFSQADALGRLERVERIAKLISEEDDPLVRSMAKSYADKLAGRLDLARSPDAFRALEQKVRDAARTAGGGVRHGGDAHARIPRHAKGAAQRREMVGALLDFPEIGEDPEVSAVLNVLEGPGAQIAAAVLRMRAEDLPLGGLLLERLGDEIAKEVQAFVRSRLVAPTWENAEEAKRILLENANRLKTVLLPEELMEIAKEQERGGEDMELLRTANAMSRARRGLSEK
jgi:DNA primase